jgi:superfamily II DNA or RNA helicase
MNQIIQRIGRILRKTSGKDVALIYTVYLSYTHDFNTLKMVRQATDIEHEIKDPRVSSSNLDMYII